MPGEHYGGGFEVIDRRDCGVEVGGRPLFDFFMALMAGVRDGDEELFVAGEPADIFGRAAARRGDQNRIGYGGIWIEEAVDLDDMLPVVAEVADVAQGPSAVRGLSGILCGAAC